ncbi:sigma-54-dependent transcriptional regulator [Kordiimonas aquimaris]|uniref:sigma-54-dependent transcriptional regulator n=1 Tax=Kordiimonas aquimaris TaxID=707591 RepID=UPI0021CE6386|nr:sigma-54 dependent transcriptional regulator [Kordiimonas aquimaris]
MATTKETVLIVEDSPTLALTYQSYLAPLGLEITLAETGELALSHIMEQEPSIILLDLKLPDMDGIDILKRLSAEQVKSRVIVITAHGSVTVAVEAMREGASDFLLKPFTAERLTTTVNNALEISRLSSLVQRIGSGAHKSFFKFIGDSSVMQAVYRMIKDSAPSKASVFIVGPSGTGKELAAEAIHQLSPRKNKRFVALNCAAIPTNLIESEIFGHVKGAFTGATSDRKGAAIMADGGTLFLDEICEMPLDLQSKLLRFIQTSQIVPVGSNTPVDVNVRFVCATNRIPADEVTAGRFREDLFYRLHVVPIHMPALRDRGQDVLAIARSMLATFSAEENKKFQTLSNDAESRLMSHNWPGNVRELGNVIQSTVVLNDGPELTADMLRPTLGTLPGQSLSNSNTSSAFVTSTHNTTPPPTHAHIPVDTIEPFAVVERRIMETAIALSGGKVRKAAKALKINPSTLYRKLERWQAGKE